MHRRILSGFIWGGIWSAAKRAGLASYALEVMPLAENAQLYSPSLAAFVFAPPSRILLTERVVELSVKVSDHNVCGWRVWGTYLREKRIESVIVQEGLEQCVVGWWIIEPSSTQMDFLQSACIQCLNESLLLCHDWYVLVGDLALG
jgi:hypothetical protein